MRKLLASASPVEGPAARHWRELVERRAQQMDAAYAALNRTSADYWARRTGTGTSILRHRASDEDPTLQTLLPRVDRQTSVLDVGAGPGRYALAIAPHVKQVVAVEPDAAMAPLLEAAIREGNASNISIVRATWQEADVEPADVVLCAHVLYPIADAVPFIRKLDDRARHACFLVLRDTMPEPEPLGRLWNQFHGEPRYLQPGYVEAFNLLHEMGIYANVRVSRIPGPTWTYPDLDGAVAAMREHLILPESAGGDAVLRSELREALVSEGEMLRLPAHDTYAAVLWWDKGP